tara:strand:+ start:432 stop:674 length:243 start_codon:yes stop_codon:yes gene_type:complete
MSIEKKAKFGYVGIFGYRDTPREAHEYALSLSQDKQGTLIGLGVVINTLINSLIEEGCLIDPNDLDSLADKLREAGYTVE